MVWSLSRGGFRATAHALASSIIVVADIFCFVLVYVAPIPLYRCGDDGTVFVPSFCRVLLIAFFVFCVEFAVMWEYYRLR